MKTIEKQTINFQNKVIPKEIIKQIIKYLPENEIKYLLISKIFYKLYLKKKICLKTCSIKNCGNKTKNICERCLEKVTCDECKKKIEKKENIKFVCNFCDLSFCYKCAKKNIVRGNICACEDCLNDEEAVCCFVCSILVEPSEILECDYCGGQCCLECFFECENCGNNCCNNCSNGPLCGLCKKKKKLKIKKNLSKK
jgi:hypothetical protein